MNEVELNQKLNAVVKMAQSCILTFLNDYANEDVIAMANGVFSKYPVGLGEIGNTVNSFGKKTIIGGFATEDSIKIPKSDVIHTSLTEKHEIDKLIGTIIHEYVHQFRKINSNYGKMFEESFATIFAETCVNYTNLKNQTNGIQSPELFNLVDSIEYQRAESQVRALLFTLKNKNMDVKLMIEYVLGNENTFQQTCSQIFGSKFNDYYNEVTNLEQNNQDNNLSEQMLIQIISDYIKTNNISVKDYWSDSKNNVSLNNLYFTGSPTFCTSIVKAGKESLKPEEQNLYQYFEYSTRVEQEQRMYVDNEIRTRIKNVINQKYGLNGKSIEEIHDVLMDICSDYIQYKSRTDKEGLIYLEEIKKVIPNIEDFTQIFKQLRIQGLDKKILDNIDLNSISYNSLFSSMNLLVPHQQNSELTNTQVEQKQDLIFYHGGAEPSFTLEQLDVLRKSQKQQNQNNSYAGFYMYSEQDREGAFHYAEQENQRNNTTTKGVEKIILDGNVNVFQMPPFSITRITQEQILELQQRGYDLIAGKMLGKTEYVLINKDKIKSMSFESMDMRYANEKSNNPSIEENNAITVFKDARTIEMEKRNAIRQQQISYAMALKMNPSEYDQYAQNVGEIKK